MALTWPSKDPQEVLDYEIDWSARIGSDTISNSVFSVVDGDVVIDSDSKTSTTTTAWLSGGSLGTTCHLANHIVTSAGREMDQTVKIKIAAK
jgi:Ni2+-binding GTPase involved in maturation of urease and hydrogenase